MTIEAILKLTLDKTKKGADRLGVKCKPYWDFIPVRNYTIPLLHILIGVFNDVDDYLIDLVSSHIIRVNRIQGTGAYLRPSKNKPPCELAISRDLAN